MALCEKRAQLYLPNDLFRRVMAAARERRASFAQLVREALEDFLRRRGGRWEQDPISRHVGLWGGPEGGLATEHDRHIYDG